MTPERIKAREAKFGTLKVDSTLCDDCDRVVDTRRDCFAVLGDKRLLCGPCSHSEITTTQQEQA